MSALYVVDWKGFVFKKSYTLDAGTCSIII